MLEARAAAHLDHPNIVRVYDVNFSGQYLYIVMELMDGGSLSQVLRESGPMDPARVVDVMGQACAGLAAAHERGIVHRDIKPSNLLVKRPDVIKLGDFGLAKVVASEDGLTRNGGVLGTPQFMSPEQCEGKPADARSDIYGIGATMYTLLTARPPYEGESTSALLYQHVHAVPPDPRGHRLALAERFSHIVARAMANSPMDRYQSVAELAEDLRGTAATDLVRESGRKLLWFGVNKLRGARSATRVWLVVGAIVII